jgi:hypothetical protein
MYLQNVNKQKKLEIFVVDVLKVTDEKSRIQSNIRTKMSWIQNTAHTLRL